MAEGLNRATLLGNLGADPELKMTQSGQAILKLRVATTSSYLDKSQQRQERTEWHSVSIWGKRGEGLAKILSKGDRVYLEGEIRTSSYEKNGEKRYSTEIVATNAVLCGGRPREGGERQQSTPGSAGGGGGAKRSAPTDAGARTNRNSTDDFGDYGPEGGFGHDEIPFAFDATMGPWDRT